MKALRFGATGSLFLLFAINLANYIDRYLVIALAKPIQDEFRLSNEEVGRLTTAFVIVYMIASPLCGWLADKVARRYVIGSAVALWSLATAFASRAWSYPVLLAARGAVGIGESGYNAAGQALLSDLFPPEKRSRVMAVFTLAMPIGVAIGFVLGGLFERVGLGWRSACLWVGLPGLALGFLALALSDGTVAAVSEPNAGESAGAMETLSAYAQFFRDPVYMTNALGFAGQAFALGGLGQWAAHFLYWQHACPYHDADLYTGAIVAGAGFVGTAVGSVLADALARRGGMIPTYAIVTGAGYLAAVPLLAVGLYVPFTPALICLFLAMVGAFLGTGPANAIVAARAPALHRAKAFALVIVILHLLGDALSPTVVGKAVDLAKSPGVPEGTAYREGLLLTPVALLLAAGFMAACAVFARRGPEKGAEAAP